MIDGEGRQVRYFLDISRFVGDFPGFSKFIDVTKLSSGAPCDHCTFRYHNIKGVKDYSFTTGIRSGHLSSV